MRSAPTKSPQTQQSFLPCLGRCLFWAFSLQEIVRFKNPPASPRKVKIEGREETFTVQQGTGKAACQGITAPKEEAASLSASSLALFLPKTRTNVPPYNP